MIYWFKRHWQVSFIGLLVLGLFAISLTQQTESGFERGIPYNIDTVHSSILFRAKHMGVAYFYGRFNEFSGNITLNESDISKSKVEFEVKSASVDTANEKRDQHLRSSDFFSVKQFPVIAFKSINVSAKAEKENMLEVTGEFDLHGVKKTITIDVEITGKKTIPQTGEVIGFHTTFDIKRSDYGFNFGMEGVNDDIQIIVSVEAANNKTR